MLEQAAIVRVATVDGSGAPHVAPFWFAFDGERIVLDTLDNATVRNIRRDDRVSVVVDLSESLGDLRTATIAAIARAYDADQAPLPVREGVDTVRRRHSEEIATPAFQAYLAREKRSSVAVEIIPQKAKWWSSRDH